MISRDDYFLGRDKQYADELTSEIEANAERTIAAANLALSMFYADHPEAHHRKANSGWRPKSVNDAAGGAKSSKHLTAEAVDIEDADRMLARWCVQNVERLKQCGILAMERAEATKTWIHWQTVGVGSGLFAYWPNTASYQAFVASGSKAIA